MGVVRREEMKCCALAERFMPAAAVVCVLVCYIPGILVEEVINFAMYTRVSEKTTSYRGITRVDRSTVPYTTKYATFDKKKKEKRQQSGMHALCPGTAFLRKLRGFAAVDRPFYTKEYQVRVRIYVVQHIIYHT